MRIASDGNVGIGTSSPDANAKLDVAGTVRSGVGGSDPGTGAVFYLVGSGSFQTVIGGAAFAVNTGANNARTERMRIASDGTTTLNVGGVSSTHQFNYNESGGEIQLVDSTGAGPILIDNCAGLARFYKVGSGAVSMGTTGANYFNFVTNNAERMRIDSSGNVGIGTTAPGYKLQVQGASGAAYAAINTTSGTDKRTGVLFQAGGTAQYEIGVDVSLNNTKNFYIYDSVSASSRFNIDSSGNVGIGESAPGAKLDVFGGTVGTTAGNLLNVTYAGGLAGGNAVGIRTRLVRASNGTDWTTTAMRLQGRVDATNFGYIDLVTGGAQGIAFGSDTSERMRIDSSGNVGVGTTSPASLLHVKRGSNAIEVYPAGTWATRVINATDGSGENGLLVGNRWAGTGSTVFEVGSIYGGGSGSWYSYYRIDGTGQSIWSNGGTERMRLDTSGRLGIGTSSPGKTLDLVGQFRVSGSAASGYALLEYGTSATATNNWHIGSEGDGTFRWYNGNFGAGTERMRIDSSGNVGIGTSSLVAGRIMTVNGSPTFISAGSTFNIDLDGSSGANGVGLEASFAAGGYGPLRFRTGGAETMRITSTGPVGIGTSTPGSKLDVTSSGLNIVASRSTTSFAAFQRFAPSGQQVYDFYNINGVEVARITADGGNLLAFSTGSAAAERMRIDSSGNVGIGTTGGDYGRPWRLVARHDQNAATNFGVINTTVGVSAAAQISKITGTGNSYLDWALVDNNGSPYDAFSYGSAVQCVLWALGGAERFRITSGGSVGIGTAIPGTGTKLNTNGRGLFTSGSYDPGDSTASGVSISYDTGSNIGIIGAIQTGVTEREMRMRGNTLTFFTNGANERMRVTETGNIGIGTTAAAQRLHVRQDQDGTTAAIIQNRNATGSPASALQFISGAFDLSDNRYAMISSAGGSNTTLQFWTAAGASPTQKMVITSAGNVGIGVASPPQLFAVGNTTDQVGAGVSGAVSTLYFGSPSTGSGGIKRLAYDRAAGALTFIGGGVVDPSTQMTIASGGEITAAVDFRAPIFYDSNDTGKYLNPNGSSVLIGTTVITRDSNSNDVFGGLELRENNVQGAATGAANEAPGINFHWSMRGAARIYMNGAGNFVFAGQSDITNNRRDIIFASGYAATRVDAPIFRDSDNTAFFFDGASTTNINTLNGNGKQIFNTGDSYLRINETSAFTNGCWFGGSLLQGGGFYTGSNGGTTNSRVAIIGGTFNGTNVITLDGPNGRITASDIRAPIFYDTDNTGFYVNPAGDTNLNKTFTYLGGKDVNANWNTGFQNTPTQSYNFHGDVSSGGPSGTWWFYESMRHSNGTNYWGTQIAWGWEDNANRLFQRNITSNTFSGWVEYLNTSNRTYNGNLNMTGSIISTSSDVRAPVFYDQNDTGYYVDPNSSLSAVFAGDITMGPELNMVVGTRGDRYIDVKGDLYFRYSDNATFYNSRMLIRQSGAILSYADFESSGNITAYASDRRLKTNIVPIKNALQKVLSIGGYTFDWDIDKCEQHGFTPTQVHEHGVIAQEIEEIMPDVVVHAPFDKETRPNHDMSASRSGEWFKTVNYDKIVPLLIEAIKEQQAHINKMQQEIEILKGDK